MNGERLPCGCQSIRTGKVIGSCPYRYHAGPCRHPIYDTSRVKAFCRHHASIAKKHYIPPQTEDVRDAKRWRVGDSL